MDVWVERELDGVEFPDQRLKARLGKLLSDLGQRIGGSVPLACQDWAATKAAYRFFDNRRVDEGVILAGHFSATSARFAATTGQVLVLHDTTEFSFKRDAPEEIGALSLIKGRHARHTVCGLLLHSSLVVTTAGVPLGLAAVKFWTRQKFKGTNALKKRVNSTRVPIEQKESVRWLDNLKQATTQLGAPARCVHIGDRESDIFELFCAAQTAETHFLVRTCVDRLAGQGDDGGQEDGPRADPGKPRSGGPGRPGAGLHGPGLPAVLPDDRPPACRLAEAVPGAVPDVIHAHERGKPEGREPSGGTCSPTCRWRPLRPRSKC